MTDDEILQIALVHATSFTSCIQFSDQDLIAFARELLDSKRMAEHQEPESEAKRELREMDRLWRLYQAQRVV